MKRDIMNQKGFVPIIVIIILALVAASVGYGAYQSFSQKPASLPAVPSVEPSAGNQPVARSKETLEINFTETGNILNWDSQTESYSEDWTLLYEKPGNPAISVKLVFSDASLCNLGGGEKICDKSKLNNGDRARVEGNRNNEEVVVINLTKL